MTAPEPEILPTTPAPVVEPEKLKTISYFEKPEVAEKFRELLGKKSQGFVTTLLSIVASSDMLKTANPQSIYTAAMTAASMDLPINPNLGFAYILPYKTKKGESWVTLAQFQMGYKGFIQLAQRSGAFKNIGVSEIREGQIISKNPLEGYQFDWETDYSIKEVIGYAGYFKLLSGFEKTIYMSVAELKQHGTKFSKTMKDGKGLRIDNFDAMCKKTILKLLLSKFAPLSIDMQRAVISDQGVINDIDSMDIEYPDNQQEKLPIGDVIDPEEFEN